MTHQIAEMIERQSEAAALRLEDCIAGKTSLIEAVRRAGADYTDLICRLIEEDAAEDAKLAAALRAGESIMPPASTLSEAVVNTEAVVDPPRLRKQEILIKDAFNEVENLPPPTEEETELHREAA